MGGLWVVVWVGRFFSLFFFNFESLHILTVSFFSSSCLFAHPADRRYKDIATNANTADTEKYEHLTDEQRGEVVKKCDESMAWLDAKKTEQAGMPKSADPVLTIAAMKEQRQAVKLVCSPIVNTPKPEPAVPEPKEDEAGAAKEGEEPKAPQAEGPAAGGKDGEADEGKKDGEAAAAEEGEKMDGEGNKDGAAAE